MSTSGQVSAGGGVDIVGLLNLLGGQKTTSTSSADTSGLQSVLAQLQGQDPSALLATIFQQAQGAMPGLQQKMTNAVGARSGGNSAVSGILQQLLKDTTIAAQKQLVDQQNTNLSLQTQAANGIANSTRSSTTKQGTNLTQLGTLLGAAQLASKLPGMDKIKGLFGDTTSSVAPAATVGGFGDSLSSPMTISDSGNAFNAASSLLNDGASSFIPGMSFNLADYTGNNLFGGATNALQDALGGNALTDTLSYAGIQPSDIIPDIGGFFGFADGGLVGRDGEKLPHYADGGVVQTAGGSRRSANPVLNIQSPQATAVRNAIQLFQPKQDQKSKSTDASELSTDGSVGQSSAATSESLGLSSGATAGVNAGIGALGMALGMATGIPGLSTAANMMGANMPTMAQVAQNIAAALGLGTGNEAAAPSNQGLAVGTSNTGFSGFADSVTGVDAATGNANGDGGQSGGGPGGDAGGDGLGGGDAGGGYANGGMLKGKGTGTSDSIPAMVSKGEYIVSADTVRAVGPDFFDFLQQAYHTPVTNSQGTDEGETAADAKKDTQHLKPAGRK